MVRAQLGGGGGGGGGEGRALQPVPGKPRVMSETNTLVVYKLSKASIPIAVSRLEELGLEGLAQLVPLASMRRVLAVFQSPSLAKQALPGILSALRSLEGCQDALIGFSLNNIDSVNSAERMANTHLQLPTKGKLWFVSPPPSPPNEWKEVLEEEPNKRTHFETDFHLRLVAALNEVGASPSDEPISPISPQDTPSPRGVTIIEANETNPELRVEHS